jgi:hypothetical protein
MNPSRTLPARLAITAIAAIAAIALLSASAAFALPPTYDLYPAPAPLGQSAGEPSLGVNWNSGNVMYIAGLETLRVTFDDSVTPAAASWSDVSFPLTGLLTLDPILSTDSVTGRTFVAQLAGPASLMAFSDDDGASWLPSTSGLASGVDHQTVGGGPLASGVPGIGYANGVYYCSQGVALASCALSLDGGLTFNPPLPLYTLLQCGGLHGHVKVAPDGTAYVPNKGCGTQQAAVASSNNGITWTVRKVPGSTVGSSDPSIGTGRDGTVYFGFVGADGHPKVAVSHNKGAAWLAPKDVGTPFGIQNAVFPAVVAGDPNRAAIAFIGTPTGGAGTGTSTTFAGVWHLYIATTYDGGASWTTVDATPTDPVQRGSICLEGTTCGSSRNLLDFMDVAVDARGRVLVGFADGCVGACVSGGPNSDTAIGVIARQSGGKGLFAAYD